MSNDKVHAALPPVFAGPARILVQPDDGVEPVVRLMGAARQSITVKQFSFTHPALLEAALGASRAGVAVRIMLNPHRSSGDRANDTAFEQLKAGGVEVEWSNPRFAVTHEKSMVIDDTLGFIESLNWETRDLTETRDYAVVTTSKREVAEMIACFNADWSRKPFKPDPKTRLIWCPNDGRERIAAFIDGAKKSLWIQNERYQDTVIIERLVPPTRRPPTSPSRRARSTCSW